MTGTSSSLHAIDLSQAKPIDSLKLKPVKLSEEQQERFRNVIESLLEHKHSKPVNLKNHPAYRPYATVQVNGKVVAALDNNGFLTTSNALGAKVQNLPSVKDSRLSGPRLAQLRAEEIAAMLGGKIVMADTALTQAQFYGLPEIRMETDYEAMKRDPLYRMLQNAQARTLFNAQNTGAVQES